MWRGVTNATTATPKTSQARIDLLARAPTWSVYTDDQGYREVVKRRRRAGDRRVLDQREQCGENALVSTVWDFNQYYVDQFEAIQNGDFVSRQLEFLDPELLRFEDWGPNVPEDVQAQVEQTFDDLASGAENPFVGPIKDNTGKVQGSVRRGAERQVPLRRVGLVRRRDPGGLSSRAGQHAAGRRA